MRPVTVLGSSLSLALVFAGASASIGCRAGGSDSSGGAGGTGSSTTKATGTGSTGTGQGGGFVCEGDEHTIQELSSGTIGKGTHVTLKSVVAMSRKFLVSGSTHCLWGVFVSAPGLSETGPNTGALALSYGTDPVVPAGGTKAFCPKIGEVAGDKIPNDTEPGDVLDVTGQTDYFPSMPMCNAMPNQPPPPQNTVPMRQMTTVCNMVKTGTAPVPKAHVLTASEITSITSTTDAAFHDAWGGVKVSVTNTGIVPTADNPPAVVGQYGIMTLAKGSIPVGDKVYYAAYLNDTCHIGPQYVDVAINFSRVEAFHYLDFCSWGLQLADKCADISPASPDCAKAMPPVTSCP